MVATHPSAFGSLLRRFRIAAGLTQEELAERARLSVRAVSDLERGARRMPYRDTVQQLADALELGEEERAAFGAAARDRAAEADLPVEEPAAVPTNLPSAPTSFIGREHEIAAIAALLGEPAIRLVTLTGPGGIGKTRLALGVAARLLDPLIGAAQYPDGVFFVPLASAQDPGWVPAAIAGALEVNERGGQGLVAALIEHLRARRLLLVLDNFEHLADARSLLAELLESCPALRLLVTTRVVLRLSWEHTFEVPPLGLDDAGTQDGATAEPEAVTLFVDRARAVKADFALNPDNAAAIAQICRSLDGLPLAIELAAARIRLFPPQALLGRLTQRLQFLTGGAHDAPARHQTLRAAIDWSYSLLGEEEKRLFARLSIFQGGCTLEAVEAVCNAEGDLGGAVLDGAASLVEKSLLRQEGAQEPRLVMLETVREYAVERLEETGDAERLEEEHTRYYLAVAEEAAPMMQGPEQGAWLDRLEVERNNLRAVLRRTRDRGDVDRGLRLALGLSEFWMVRGPLSEGRGWLEDLAAAGGTPALKAAAFYAAGKLTAMEGLSRASAELFERSLVLFRELGDRRASAEVVGWLPFFLYQTGEAGRGDDLLRQSEVEGRETGDQRLLTTSLRTQAALAVFQGARERARTFAEESLELYRGLEDNEGIARVLPILAGAAYGTGDGHMARALTDELLTLLRRLPLYAEQAEWLQWLAYQARILGDYAYATRCFDELEARAIAVGDRRIVAQARAGLASLAREQGDYRRAEALYGKSLAVTQEIGDRLGHCRVLVGLSDVARDQGDAERAIDYGEESLALLQETEDVFLTAYALHNLGLAAWHQGDHSRAERLIEEALDLFRSLGKSFDAVEIHLSMGLLALDQRRYDLAGEIFAECLVTARRFESRWLMGTLLEGIGGVAAGMGQADRAARLFGAAEVVREAMGIVRWPAHRNLYERSAAAARDALGEERFLEALERGRGLSLEEAVAEALNER